MRARVVLAIAALAAAGLALQSGGAGSVHGPLRSDQAIHGWTILSDSEADAREVIGASRAYGINHLQLSHQIVEDLRQIREPRRQALVRRLIFGFRVYARGESFRTPALMRATRDALAEIPTIASAIREYPVKPPVGQWNWAGDADAAMRYYDAIARTGWPKETHGVVNSYGGLTFPLAGGR